jgi:hypothetical protein
MEVLPDDRLPLHDAGRSKLPRLVAAVIALVVLVVAGYELWRRMQAPPPPTPAPTASSEPAKPAEAVPPTPKPEHPIEAAAVQENLPALAESDAAAAYALSDLLGKPAFDQLLMPESLVRHVVVTIDNLPRHQVATRLNPVQPVPGQLRITGGGNSMAVSGDNAARYGPYVKALEGVDSKKLVALYVHFYPLFQQAYVELGYPQGYFNDRVFQVIDHLLAAPEPGAKIALTQPKVLYEYADPALEELSAGQKMMVRMGPANEARVKAKLREIRKQLQQ